MELTRHVVLEEPGHAQLIAVNNELTALKQYVARLEMKLNASETREQELMRHAVEYTQSTDNAMERLRTLWNAHANRTQSTINELESQVQTLTATAQAHEKDAESAIADLTATRLMLKSMRRQTAMAGSSGNAGTLTYSATSMATVNENDSELAVSPASTSMASDAASAARTAEDILTIANKPLQVIAGVASLFFVVRIVANI
jgi:hypothetical protein